MRSVRLIADPKASIRISIAVSTWPGSSRNLRSFHPKDRMLRSSGSLPATSIASTFHARAGLRLRFGSAPGAAPLFPNPNPNSGIKPSTIWATTILETTTYQKPSTRIGGGANVSRIHARVARRPQKTSEIQTRIEDETQGGAVEFHLAYCFLNTNTFYCHFKQNNPIK